MVFQFDRNTFWTQFSREFGNPAQSAKDGLSFILDRIEQDTSNWENVNQIAYALATFKWETAHTFQPIHERGPESYFTRYDPGTKVGQRLGNTQPGDGYRFRGRGYVQLTGRTNYSRDGQLLGIDLVSDPDKALQPDVAYEIASRGMKEGWFTGHRLSQYLATGGTPDYFNARQIINGHDRAQDIAAIAEKFDVILTASQQSDAGTDETATGANA